MEEAPEGILEDLRNALRVLEQRHEKMVKEGLDQLWDIFEWIDQRNEDAKEKGEFVKSDYLVKQQHMMWREKLMALWQYQGALGTAAFK